MTEDREAFLSRWSRIKSEARDGDRQAQQDPPDLAEAKPPVAPAEPAGESGLPPVESLDGVASEYRGFMSPQIGDGLRRAALKKLFSDPHFNAIDPNEAYSGDFTQSETIDAAMMKTIEHAKRLLFEESQGAGGEARANTDKGQPPRPRAENPAQKMPEEPHEQGISGQASSDEPAGFPPVRE